MPWMALVGGLAAAGGSIGGGLMGASASDKASKEQQEASRISNELQLGIFLRNWYDMKPFREAAEARLPYQQRGLEEYEQLRQEGPGKFEESDYYGTLQGAIGQAATALGKQAAARGGGAGSIGRDLAAYAVPLAGQMRGQQINEWLTQLGPAAQQGMVGTTPYLGTTGQMAGMAAQAGRDIGAGIRYGGEARAGGYLGRSAALQSAISGGIGSLTQAYGMYNQQRGDGGGFKQPGYYEGLGYGAGFGTKL